jgi:hypothetical protein
MRVERTEILLKAAKGDGSWQGQAIGWPMSFDTNDQRTERGRGRGEREMRCKAYPKSIYYVILVDQKRRSN